MIDSDAPSLLSLGRDGALSSDGRNWRQEGTIEQGRRYMIRYFVTSPSIDYGIYHPLVSQKSRVGHYFHLCSNLGKCPRSEVARRCENAEKTSGYSHFGVIYAQVTSAEQYRVGVAPRLVSRFLPPLKNRTWWRQGVFYHVSGGMSWDVS